MLILVGISAGLLRRTQFQPLLAGLTRLDEDDGPVRALAFWLDVLLCVGALRATQLAEVSGTLWGRPELLVIPATIALLLMIYVATVAWLLRRRVGDAGDKPSADRAQAADQAFEDLEPWLTVVDTALWAAIVVTAAPDGLPFMALFLFSALHTFDAYIEYATSTSAAGRRNLWVALLHWRPPAKLRTWMLLAGGGLTAVLHQRVSSSTLGPWLWGTVPSPPVEGGPVYVLMATVGLYVVLAWRYAEEWGVKRKAAERGAQKAERALQALSERNDYFHRFMHNVSHDAQMLLEALRATEECDIASSQFGHRWRVLGPSVRLFAQEAQLGYAVSFARQLDYRVRAVADASTDKRARTCPPRMLHASAETLIQPALVSGGDYGYVSIAPGARSLVYGSSSHTGPTGECGLPERVRNVVAGMITEELSPGCLRFVRTPGTSGDGLQQQAMRDRENRDFAHLRGGFASCMNELLRNALARLPGQRGAGPGSFGRPIAMGTRRIADGGGSFVVFFVASCGRTPERDPLDEKEQSGLRACQVFAGLLANWQFFATLFPNEQGKAEIEDRAERIATKLALSPQYSYLAGFQILLSEEGTDGRSGCGRVAGQ